MFQVNLKDIKNMQQFAKRAPKQFGHAARNFQNRVAWVMRDMSMITVSRMTNRSPKFNKSRLRVKKATGTNINRMAAIMGSIKSLRHTGWIEQETGKRQIRKRSFTLEARGNSWEKKARPSIRLKPGKAMLDPEKDGHGKSKEQRLSSMLSMIRKGALSTKVFKTRKNYRGKLKSMSRGVFQYKRRKIIRMQKFERPKQPRRNPWMTKARQLLVRRFNTQREWSNVVTQQLQFIK